MRTFSRAWPLKARLILLTAVLLSASQGSWAEIRWLESTPGYTQAYKENQKNGKPFLVYFTSRMCGWCKRLETSVLADPVVAQALSKYNCVRMWMSERQADYNLSQQFRVTGTPTLFFYSGSPARKKRIFWQIQGGRPASAQEFLSQF